MEWDIGSGGVGRSPDAGGDSAQWNRNPRHRTRLQQRPNEVGEAKLIPGHILSSYCGAK